MTSFRLWNRHHRRALPALLAGLGAAAASVALSAAPLAGDTQALIEKFLRTQLAGLPGQARIEFAGQGAELPACDALEPFLPPGAVPRGRVSVGVRCGGAKPWTRFVQAQITVEGRYYVAARAIEPGQPLGAADVLERSGDLSRLPRTVVTDAAELIGVVAVNRVAAGAPLRKDLVRGAAVVQQGQTVQLVAQGAGFTVSTEGKAMNRAEVGGMVQAKTRDGRVLSGVAGEDGQIRLSQ